jgi:hypothetical protein
VRDIGRGEGGEVGAGAPPEGVHRGVTAEPTPATTKRPAAQRVFRPRIIRLCCSVADGPPGILALVSSLLPAWVNKTGPLVIFSHAQRSPPWRLGGLKSVFMYCRLLIHFKLAPGTFLSIKSLMFVIPPRSRRSRRSARGRPLAWPFARCLPRPWPSGVSALSPTRPGGVDSDAARTNSKDKFRYLLVPFGCFRSSPREPAAPEKMVRGKYGPERSRNGQIL